MLTRLGLIVTQRCDLKCAHCLRGYPSQPLDFPLELLPRLLDEARPFGVKHVALTGGEPHLHPQFTEIVRTISEAGFTWHFVSNGQQTALYLSVIESHLDSFTGVTLSIDGVNAKTHNAIRNSPHAFERTIAAAREYADRGYKLRLSACLSRLNQNQAADLLKLAIELGAEGVNFGVVIPTPWNIDLVLDDAEKLALYEQIQELCQDSPIPIRRFTSLHSCGGAHFCNQLSLHEVTIDTRGEMAFCCDLVGIAHSIGSIYKQSFAALLSRWLQLSADLQAERVRRIASGEMAEGFDSCEFCNQFFSAD